MGELLRGGNMTPGVVRIGATVRRPRDHRSPFAFRALRFLNDAGFQWAPEHLGVDDEGRDILSYVEGMTTDHPLQRDEAAYPRFGEILRHLHTVTRGAPIAEGDDCLVHGDPGPFNVIMRGGLPVALIDWDSVHPGDPMVDVGYAGWTWCIQSTGDVPIVDQARRLRGLADGYGHLEPGALIDAILNAQSMIIEGEAAAAEDETLPADRRRHAAAAVAWARSSQGLLRAHLDVFRAALHRDPAGSGYVSTHGN